LLDAWARLPGVPLRIVGDGPLAKTRVLPDVTWLGSLGHAEVFAEMQHAAMLIFPSTCYEVAPLTIIEAFATGLPVLASNLGAMPDFVSHRRNGLLFQPGDAEDLARQVQWAFDHPEALRAMRDAARREYEERYT